jgi:hypothetical protein
MKAIYVEGTKFAAEECVPPDQEPCSRANISHFGFRKNLTFAHITRERERRERREREERDRVKERERERERERDV